MGGHSQRTLIKIVTWADDLSAPAEIARVAGNPALEPLLSVFRTRSRRHQIFTLPEGPEIKRVSDAGHREIAGAIAQRDPVAAAAAASAHIAHSEKWVRHLLELERD
ncbi:FCD domain-containing protein [Streptomyces sp. NBC_01361]|uniref:FCD domain-containing protein n=1 Tax=Streptomyces sp. NBC_01361 TaxID=2903838 RepID=UPI002E3029CD|nr:FCD domain-containing protein [Streptomyces sp. NBC_01361]